GHARGREEDRVVGVHRTESFEIAAVPGGHLVLHEGADLRGGIRGGEEEQERERAHDAQRSRTVAGGVRPPGYAAPREDEPWPRRTRWRSASTTSPRCWRWRAPTRPPRRRGTTPRSTTA